MCVGQFLWRYPNLRFYNRAWLKMFNNKKSIIVRVAVDLLTRYTSQSLSNFYGLSKRMETLTVTLVISMQVSLSESVIGVQKM